MDQFLDDDDDDESYVSPFADGHWEWDDQENELKFIRGCDRPVQLYIFPTYISDFHPVVDAVSMVHAVLKLDPLDFRDDMDLIEQQRFKKRMQRKSTGDSDVVTLQDVKDIVLYTAPVRLVTPKMMNIIHSRSVDRFLRALILYFQYYLQIADVMSTRVTARHNYINTPCTEKIENDYRDNLNDLRLLVGKEYCNIIMGADDSRKFHHVDAKGKPNTKYIKRETLVYEPLIRLSVQIVWIALSRKSYPVIEAEINRLFRTNKFNVIHHKIFTDESAPPELSSEEQAVLQGNCTDNHKTYPLTLHSPFFNELFCPRDIDLKLFGLGVLKYNNLSSRLTYLEDYLIHEEEKFSHLGISLGIIGLPRNKFDIMLRLIKIPTERSENRASLSFQRHSTSTRPSLASKKPSKTALPSSDSAPTTGPTFRDMNIPPKTPDKSCEEFPIDSQRRLHINKTQRRKWLLKSMRKLTKQRNGQSS